MKSENKYQPKIWTEERNQWLIENTKGLPRDEAYKLFCERFPEVNATLIAVSNQRSRLRCAMFTSHHGSTKAKPLYSEHEKRGYIFVKVAMPSVWWSKAKFVFVATHPEEAGTYKDTDAFYFLDGNNRNFDPDNIIRVHRNEQTIFMQMGGVIPGRPELTKLNYLRAVMKLKQFDCLEKLGEIEINSEGSRIIRAERNRKAREYHRNRYHTDPEYRARTLAYQKNMSPAAKAHLKEYKKQWHKRKKEKERKQKEDENKVM